MTGHDHLLPLDAMTLKRYNGSMSTAAVQKTTLYLQPTVKRYLQHMAIEQGTSVSALVNDLVEDELEERQLAKEIERRRKEPTITQDEMMKELGLTYDDLRD